MLKFLCFLFLSFCLDGPCSICAASLKSFKVVNDNITLSIDTSHVIATTRDEYVSWNLDSTANRDFFTRNIDDPQLSSFAKELSPSYMRVGGTGAKFLFYQLGTDANKTWPGKIHWQDGKYNWSWTPHYMNATLWDSVNHLAQNSNSKLVFNMDEAVFVADKGENFRNLLTYSIHKGYSINAIEASNEQGTPTAEVLKAIWKVLTDLYPDVKTRPKLIGPDESNISPMKDIRENAHHASVPLFAVTYHDYNYQHAYQDCEGVLKAYIKPNNTIFYSTVAGAEQWIGESATCGQGGKVNVSDSFASGFWYWSYLGRLAQLNHKVFLRQTLVGGNYGLLRDHFWDHSIKKGIIEPNADYFSGILFTRIMGNEVFSTNTPNNNVQAYAHCARPGQKGYKNGALAVALINLYTTQKVVIVHNKALDRNSPRIDYIMTTADLGGSPFSKYAKINGGKKLTTAADLVGKKEVGNSIILPAQSYGVVMFPDAGITKCFT